MSEYKMIHDILQRIDDDLIDEAVGTKKSYFPIRKFATAAAIIMIGIFFSVGVAAAISPPFREELLEAFQNPNVPELPKTEEVGKYWCNLVNPEKDEKQEFFLTEDEIESVLDIIRESESEKISEKNSNMEYAEKEGTTICISTEYDNHKFTYRLVLVEENVLTYSIEKISLESGKETDKQYVIYSEELYDLVMEKIRRENNEE